MANQAVMKFYALQETSKLTTKQLNSSKVIGRNRYAQRAGKRTIQITKF